MEPEGRVFILAILLAFAHYILALQRQIPLGMASEASFVLAESNWQGTEWESLKQGLSSAGR
jgi:hypothetical protein